MEPLENIVQEITSFENQLNRRNFIKVASLLTVLPGLSLNADDQEFLRRVALTLLPAAAIRTTGIDVAENIDHMLRRGGAEQRKKVLRFLAWSRRAAILYGGNRVAINGRGSRFMLVRKMARTLSSICLIAFWADERAFTLIVHPEEAA